MKLIIAAVADHAWVENGCLTICRTFDTINAPEFPYKIPRISIGVRILVGRSEYGAHALTILLRDAEGNKLINAKTDINVLPPPNDLPETSFSIAVNGQNIEFKHTGDYQVVILTDDVEMANIPIYVRTMKT
ncbi:MAG: hypothetical protein KBD53_12115 [Candidatus Omnitrophica bacterium]|nr:hypothetical protein [Candidatus Omnitrophota bacterium]